MRAMGIHSAKEGDPQGSHNKCLDVFLHTLCDGHCDRRGTLHGALPGGLCWAWIPHHRFLTKESLGTTGVGNHQDCGSLSRQQSRGSMRGYRS